MKEKLVCFEAVDVPKVIWDWLVEDVMAVLLAGTTEARVVCPVVFDEGREKLNPELLPLKLCPEKEKPLVDGVTPACVDTAVVAGVVTAALKLKLVDCWGCCGFRLNREGAPDIAANPVLAELGSEAGLERADARKLCPT